jgi:hypothetical protein
MGFGNTHVLSGVSKTVHHRETMKIYWVHLVWTISLLIRILAIWWGMFWWTMANDWQFFQFLFLAAGMLYPWSIPEDFDFEHHYMHKGKWFFGIMFAAGERGDNKIHNTANTDEETANLAGRDKLVAPVRGEFVVTPREVFETIRCSVMAKYNC